MCQATVYLDGNEIMKDVLLVEPVPDGIRLVTFFEPQRIVPAKNPHDRFDETQSDFGIDAGTTGKR